MLHITIGTTPIMPPSLEPDLRMVKASLLYADKIKLCSAAYSIWMPDFLNKNKTTEQLIIDSHKFEEIVPHLITDKNEIIFQLTIQRIARKLLQKDHLSQEEEDFLKKYREIASLEHIFFKAQLLQFPTLNLEKANEEFEKAVNAGLLEIHKYEINESEDNGIHQIKGTFNEAAKRISNEFLNVIMDTVSDLKTYPLFDDGAGGLVNLSVDLKLLSPTQTRIAQAKQSKLAAEVLQRLPVFDEASISEVLDIRKELERHLIRFRSAIVKYSEKIRNEAWNEEFLIEAEEIFHREIEPAVLDIEDAVKSNSSLLALTTRKLVDKSALTATVGTSIFSFFVSQQTALPQIVNTLMQIGSVGIGTTTAIYDAYKERQKQHNELQKNQLYFYYKAGRLLNK